MIDRLLVHTGDCKTGSTSIQRVLVRNAWSAPGQSICFPTEADHNFIAHTLTREEQMPFREERFGDLRRAFEDSDAALGIMSSEHLEFVNPEVFRDALREFLPEFLDDLQIITYVRPHAERLLSGFAERSKVGNFDGSMAEFFDFCREVRLLNYADRLDHWKAVFGGQVTVRPMVRRALMGQDVVSDFFHQILPGVEVALKPLDKAASNSSLPLEWLVYVRAIHRHIRHLGGGEFPDQQHNLGWYMGDLMHAQRGGVATKLRLHRTLAEAVQAEYAEDAARIDSDHLETPVMAARLATAVSDAVDQPQSLLATDHFSPRDLGQMRAHIELIHRAIRRTSLDDFKYMFGADEPHYGPPAPLPPEEEM